EGRYRYTKRANVLFYNNLVTSSNLIFDFLNSVHLEYCSGLTVTHNDFVHTSRGAVSFDHSYDVLIEYNNFDSVMENSEDGGAVYNWGSVDGWSIRVCHNYFGPMHRDGTGCFGYYIDDCSGGAEVYENLFYNAVIPVMIHMGRDNSVHDNLIIDTNSYSGVGLSHGERGMIDEMGYEEAVKQWPFTRTRNWWASVFDLIDAYPEYRAGVEKWCPGILDCTMDPERVDDPEFYLNPVNSIYGNVCFNPAGEEQHRNETPFYVRYIDYGDSTGVPLDENPCFVNPTLGDYRVRSGVGFPDIQFDKIGRY
ncbi:MAG: right-handed parallel beta-helix repeat-containing protein, partial [Clostridia bacterium]|nr:right-handed parallel beta-helix repeat-containing protein [Clostridia bacterium]